MSSGTGARGMASALIVALGLSTTARANPESRHVMVELRDGAGSRAEVLELARLEVSRIYEAAQVAIRGAIGAKKL